MDLGYSSRRFVKVMSEAFVVALSTHNSVPRLTRGNER